MIKRTNKTKSISSIIPNVLNPVKKKSNKIMEIKLNWNKILNDNLSKFSFPNKIYKFNNKKTLEISVQEEKLIEISYNSDLIKREINRFYGHEHIELIKFKKKFY